MQDFELKILSRVRFWIEKHALRQILNLKKTRQILNLKKTKRHILHLKKYNASAFEFEKKRVIFWI